MKNFNSETVIDAVIPWVNGNDPVWQKKINTYSDKKINFDNAKSSARFNSIGEIDIAITSIIKFASFVKTIYLVTDQQIPDKFDNLKKSASLQNIDLKIIDHKTIFKDFENSLPCFNSRSIESLFFKIPNITERFIVFNDDTFLMRKTEISDFFSAKTPVVRGKWKPFNEDRILKNLYIKLKSLLGKTKKSQKDSNKLVMQNSAKIVGFSKYIRRYHTPFALKKSTIDTFFKANPEILQNNIKHRFRHKSQFMISSLCEHLEAKKHNIKLQNTQLTYFRNYKKHFVVKLKLWWFDVNNNKLFVTCQSLELAKPKTQKYILDWIDKKLS